MLEETNTHGSEGCKSYRFTLNHDLFFTENPSLTGRELLKTAGIKDPDRYTLFELTDCGPEEVHLDDQVGIDREGRERFKYRLSKGVSGLAAEPRRDFVLPERVELELSECGIEVDAIQDQTGRWLVTRELDVPAGLAPRKARMGVRCPSGPAACDMFFMDRCVKHESGASVERTTGSIPGPDGLQWQQWSRHYPKDFRWDASRDNVASHLATCLVWFANETEGGK